MDYTISYKANGYTSKVTSTTNITDEDMELWCNVELTIGHKVTWNICGKTAYITVIYKDKDGK